MESKAVTLSDSRIPFNFNGHDFQVIIDWAGNPNWIAKEVCEYFGDSHYRRSVGRLADDEKGVTLSGTPGGTQSMTTVNEAGLWHLLLCMRPQKKKTMTDAQYFTRVRMVEDFRRWITHEVLPSIRRTGGYSLNGEPDLTSTVRELVNMVRELGSIVKDILPAIKGSQTNILPAVRPIAQRDQVGKVVRTYAKNNRLDFQACWKELYSEFLYRYHIDLYQRAQAKGTTGVAIAEELGMIDDLLALANFLYSK